MTVFLMLSANHTDKAPLFKHIFVRLLLIVSVMLAASLFLTGCATSKAVMISKSELAHLSKSDSPPTIVDVRSSEEYDAGHIPGAIHIPWWGVLTRHCNVPSAYEEPLIISVNMVPVQNWRNSHSGL